MYDKKKKLNEKKYKNNFKCRSNCAIHKFSIKPKRDHLYHGPQTVNYCPHYSQYLF